MRGRDQRAVHPPKRINTGVVILLTGRAVAALLSMSIERAAPITRRRSRPRGQVFLRNRTLRG